MIGEFRQPANRWCGTWHERERMSIGLIEDREVHLEAFDRSYRVRQYNDRLAISRARAAADWDPPLSWYELQSVKNMVWGTERLAVELYPSQTDVVNLRNTRHLWLLPWRTTKDIREVCRHPEFYR